MAILELPWIDSDLTIATSLCLFSLECPRCRAQGLWVSLFQAFPGSYTLPLQIIQAQRRRDETILHLLQTMEDTYAFVTWADKLKENPVLQDIAEQILKQTIECGFFILECSRRTSGRMYSVARSLPRVDMFWAAKALVQPFSGVTDSEVIKRFRDEFARLHKNFDTGVDLGTALLLARTASTVDAIRMCKLTNY